MIGQSLLILTILLTLSILTFKKHSTQYVHTNLLYKLSAIGIPPLQISYTAAFLANRSQQISVMHCLSTPSPYFMAYPKVPSWTPYLFCFLMTLTLFQPARQYLNCLPTTSNYIPRFRIVIRTPQSKSLVSAGASIRQLPINRSKSQHLHLCPITQFPPNSIGGH